MRRYNRKPTIQQIQAAFSDLEAFKHVTPLNSRSFVTEPENRPGGHNSAHAHAGSFTCSSGRLDKLAQLRTASDNQNVTSDFFEPSGDHQSKQYTLKDLRKRARSKYITNGLIIQLAGLKSPLKKSYWNSFHCAAEVVQRDQVLTSKYCNARWCITCNRIRTAKLWNGYMDPLKEIMPEAYFVTLTFPNVTGDQLKIYIEHMHLVIRRISDAMRNRRKVKLIGIRKLECTYNEIKNTYHPHFHLIVKGEEAAKILVEEWKQRFPGAVDKAQDIRKADEGSVQELFKYFAKLLSNTKGERRFNPVALDTIFQSMKGRRVFQPMGIKKNVSEDIEQLQSIIYTDLQPEENKIWEWRDPAADWIDTGTGELLTGYNPSDTIKRMRAGIGVDQETLLQEFYKEQANELAQLRIDPPPE